ncbi:HAMP domain-containing histidine kinase [Clostridium sp. 19966]|uniref:sensor histidine kinase n=1 Tax=Clostridium sp. 19966 TaxID=2768166 RepID=UPI0028DE31AB|nr:HAMP domain-containing sensor histidine kinase [Clostridium sp. 19966]MDT8716850.1 HAMP domain-containing histidine kinase [Clostridium sp. 19966]
MNKKIFKNFLLDHLSFTASYFISNILIGVFYYLSAGKDIEIAYPACISIFVYVVFILYKWITYRNFNVNASKLVENVDYDIKSYSSESKELVRIIGAIHRGYLEKLNGLSSEQSNQKRFLSQWIHNMKTPVAVMDLILQKNKKGEIENTKALEDIGEESLELENKLNQVLNMLRLEEFSQDYNPETVDLVTSVRKIINDRKSQFIYNKIYPKIQEKGKLLVLTDEKWNEAMLEQILSNAIKYSAGRDKYKNVYFIFNSEEDKVSLTIKDEGIGIPKHDLERVFKPFFTGDNGRVQQGATGIGLYFCSEVAKKLGHTIHIKSELGVGTEVTIEYLSKL